MNGLRTRKYVIVMKMSVHIVCTGCSMQREIRLLTMLVCVISSWWCVCLCLCVCIVYEACNEELLYIYENTMDKLQ